MERHETLVEVDYHLLAEPQRPRLINTYVEGCHVVHVYESRDLRRFDWNSWEAIL